MEREAHITLTYSGAMQDRDKLYGDVKRWFLRLQYGYPDHSFDYVAIMEPHGHGGWHIHLLLKSDQPLWRTNRVEGLDYDKVRKMWRGANGTGEGSTYHARLGEDVENIGAYFGAYFTTIVPEGIEIALREAEATGDENAVEAAKKALQDASKAAKKGSRIHHYPAGFNFYRCTAGIERPKPEKEKYGKTLEDYGKPVYQAAYAIVDDETGERMQYIQVFDFDTKKQ
jgi:hypothetical protein